MNFAEAYWPKVSEVYRMFNLWYQGNEGSIDTWSYDPSSEALLNTVNHIYLDNVPIMSVESPRKAVWTWGFQRVHFPNTIFDFII